MRPQLAVSHERPAFPAMLDCWVLLSRSRPSRCYGWASSLIATHTLISNSKQTQQISMLVVTLCSRVHDFAEYKIRADRIQVFKFENYVIKFVKYEVGKH